MQRQATQQIKIAFCFVLAFPALMLAGCGNHDQAGAGGGSGTMTPQQVQQNAIQQNQSPATAGGQTPAGTPGH